MKGYFSIKVALTSIFICGFISTSASAADVVCNRKGDNWSGFVSKAAFESWYPKTIYFEPSAAKTHKTNRVRFSKGYEQINGSYYTISSDIIWELLPNSQLIAQKAQKGGFKATVPVKYKCDQTPAQILSGATSSGGSGTDKPEAVDPDLEKAISKAIDICSDLGFEAGSEKHADCVLKLIDR